MKKAFIFPGQASQFIGMGSDLYNEYSIAADVFNRANEIMDTDLKSLCFNGPEEELKKTYITQPAIFVHSVAVFKILKERGFEPQGVAGHSLGEYSALVAAGALDYEDGLRLVKKRGELMYQAGIDKPGTMAAIIGLSPEDVASICSDLKSTGVVQPANFNSPGQIAISGDVTTIKKAIEMAKEKGAKKAVELVVSGAFHSPLMESARQGLKSALEQVEIKDAQVPLYSNVEAGPVQDNDKIRSLLYQQLTKPVLWQQLIENMVKDGFEEFYEIGPGKVLRGLQKRINRQTPCLEIGTVENLKQMGE